MHLAPDGFRIRLMEPGEAETLLAIGAASGLFDGAMPQTPDFVRWLLQHEVFVAQADDGRHAGFAAARDATDLYWLSGLGIDPAFKGRGVRKALLSAVVTRAGWFFHRAVALGAPDEESANWYRRRRFLAIDRSDWTPELAGLARENPGFANNSPAVAETSGLGHALVGTERTLMVHWI